MCSDAFAELDELEGDLLGFGLRQARPVVVRAGRSFKMSVFHWNLWITPSALRCSPLPHLV